MYQGEKDGRSSRYQIPSSAGSNEPFGLNQLYIPPDRPPVLKSSRVAVYEWYLWGHERTFGDVLSYLATAEASFNDFNPTCIITRPHMTNPEESVPGIRQARQNRTVETSNSPANA